MTSVSGTNTVPQPTVVINFDQNSKSSYLGSLFNGVTSIARLPIDVAAWTAQKGANAIASTATKSAEIAGKVVNAAIEPVIEVAAFAAKVTTTGAVAAGSYLVATRPEDTYTFLANLKESGLSTLKDSGSKAFTYFSRKPKWIGLSHTESPFETDLRNLKETMIPDLKMRLGYLGDLATNAGSYTYKKAASGATQTLNYFTGPDTYYDSIKQNANGLLETGKAAARFASDELVRHSTELASSIRETYSAAKSTAANIVEATQINAKLLSDEISSRTEDFTNSAKETYSSAVNTGTEFVEYTQTKASDLMTQGSQLLEATQTSFNDLYASSTLKANQFVADTLVKTEQVYSAVKNAPSDFTSYVGNKTIEGYNAVTSFASTKAADGYSTAASTMSDLIGAASTRLSSAKYTVIGTAQNATHSVSAAAKNAISSADEAARSAIQSTGEYFGSQTGYSILDHEITNGDVALGTLALVTTAAASYIGFKYLRAAFANRAEDSKKIEA